MKIVVFGAGGQLGAAIVREFAAIGNIVSLGRADLDITDAGCVAERITAEAPALVVNCAAYNHVDAAEDEPVVALEVNALAVRSLARAAEASGATLVHYGTDFVFDGRATRPYTEEDRPNPQSVYAASKLLGEWFATDAPRHYVLRVETLFGHAAGGPPAKGSIATIVQTLLDGGEARVFEDRTISPTYVIDAARATRQIVESRAPAGLYHCVNSGLCTLPELARELARQLGVKARLAPVCVTDVSFRARRPQYCALSNQKLVAAGIVMPPWQDALARYLQSVHHQIPG